MRIGKTNIIVLLVITLIISICIYTIYRTQVYVVSDDSMLPSLVPGERIISSKIRHKHIPNLLGKILIFYFPFGSFDEIIQADSTIIFIKRCVGAPGDTVTIEHSNYLEENRPTPMTAWDVITNLNENKRDNIFKMSPVYVPSCGDTIKTTDLSYPLYKKIINYENRCGNISNDSAFHVFDRNYYFVCGDNYFASSDSRYWGFVPEEFIISYKIF